MATVIVDSSPSRARGARSRFYVGAAFLIAVITLAGFAPALYATLFENVTRPWFIHLHAVVFVGWLVLLVTQSVLAAQGKIAMHQRVGNFGIAYGCLVFALGAIVAIPAAGFHIVAGEWTPERGAALVGIALGDILLFAGFFGAAVAYRRRPEIHKRLMLLATVALMLAGVGRLWFLGSPPNVPLALALWYSPVLLGIVYDYVTRRRVHPVYWIGAVAMGIHFVTIPIVESAVWRALGRRLQEFA